MVRQRMCTFDAIKTNEMCVLVSMYRTEQTNKIIAKYHDNERWKTFSSVVDKRRRQWPRATEKQPTKHQTHFIFPLSVFFLLSIAISFISLHSQLRIMHLNFINQVLRRRKNERKKERRDITNECHRRAYYFKFNVQLNVNRYHETSSHCFTLVLPHHSVVQSLTRSLNHSLGV